MCLESYLNTRCEYLDLYGANLCPSRQKNIPTFTQHKFNQLKINHLKIKHSGIAVATQEQKN